MDETAAETSKHPGYFKTSWQSVEKTFLKSEWVNSAQLPDDMKIALEPGAMLECYSQPSQNNHVKFVDAYLNGEPLRPEICFINRSHWKRLAIEEPAAAPLTETVAPPLAETVAPPLAETVAPPLTEPVAPPPAEPVVAVPEPLPPVIEETVPVMEPILPPPLIASPPVFEAAPAPVMPTTRELPPRRARAHFLQKVAAFFKGEN